MGKKSIKENKNVYQISREEAGLTRAAASELMEFISADRIEKIESEKSAPHADEIMAMSKVYKDPELCNHYCSNECPIGQRYVPEIKIKELSQITLEMIASLNAMENEKNRLIEITVDGKISEDEQADFAQIKKKLDDIAISVQSLQMWIDNAILTGCIIESNTP